MIRRLSFVVLALVVVAGYLFAQKTSSFNGFEPADKNRQDSSQAGRLSRSLRDTWFMDGAGSEGKPNAFNLCLARFG